MRTRYHAAFTNRVTERQSIEQDFLNFCMNGNGLGQTFIILFFSQFNFHFPIYGLSFSNFPIDWRDDYVLGVFPISHSEDALIKGLESELR